MAIESYKELLNSNDESIKFRVASAIFDNTLKLIENKEIKEGLNALKNFYTKTLNIF